MEGSDQALGLSNLSNTASGTTWLNGYYCSCGVWVTYGSLHQCCITPNNQQSYVWPSTWSYPTMPTIHAFKGSVKNLDDLPTSGVAVGDAYFVEKIEALVVRQSNGWFHFDRK